MTASESTWPALIAFAEHQLKRAEMKVAQLKAAIATFERAAAAGEPSPIDLAAAYRADKTDKAK